MLSAALTVISVLWVLRAFNAALSLALVPDLAPAPRRKDGSPFVSIVVPARDEERAIEVATRSKCLQDCPAFEVVVAKAARPGDWLVFSDADVVFAPDLLARALAHAEKNRLDFLTLLPQMEARTFGERLMVPTIPAAAPVRPPARRALRFS